MALTLSAIATSACGGDTSGSSTGDGLSTRTQDAVEAAYEGIIGEPPTTSPKPQPGMNIWLVTLSPDLGAPNELAAAADLMGWDVTVFDGKFSPDIMVSGLRQAVADDADGVVVAYADCADIKAGLEDLAEADIPVVNIESTDCDVNVGDDGALTDSGQPGLFDAQVGYHNPDDPASPLIFAEAWRIFAEYQGLGIIEGTQGGAKIIVLSEVDIRLNFVSLRRLKETLADHCPDCEIVETVEFTGAEFGPALQDKVAQALVQHPEANAIYGIYDAPTQDVAAAVIQSGRQDDVFVMGGEGTAPIVDLISQERGVNAGVGFSVVWEVYAALDAINRLLHGEEPPDGVAFPSGVGLQLFTKSRNLPPEGERYSPAVDFEAAYRKAWGVD